MLNQAQSFFQGKLLEVYTASSGNSGIDLLDRLNIDIVISAYHMSMGDGMKLLEYSRSKINPPLFYFYDSYPHEAIVDTLIGGAIDFFSIEKNIEEVYFEIMNDYQTKMIQKLK